MSDIQLSLSMSPELNIALNNMANVMHSSTSEVLLKSIVLMQLAVNEKEKGNHLGIMDNDRHFLTEIVGF